MLYRLQYQPISTLERSWLYEFEVASDKMAIEYAIHIMEACPFERCILNSESNHLGTFTRTTTVKVAHITDGRLVARITDGRL